LTQDYRINYCVSYYASYCASFIAPVLLRLGQFRMRCEPRGIEPMHGKADNRSGYKRERRPHIELLHRHTDEQRSNQRTDD
jgi:hypothetical protein